MKNKESCIKTDELCIKTRDFALKTRNCVSKTRKSRLKMMNFAGVSDGLWDARHNFEPLEPRPVSKNDELCFKNKELCSKNKELCI